LTDLLEAEDLGRDSPADPSRAVRRLLDASRGAYVAGQRRLGVPAVLASGEIPFDAPGLVSDGRGGPERCGQQAQENRCEGETSRDLHGEIGHSRNYSDAKPAAKLRDKNSRSFPPARRAHRQKGTNRRHRAMRPVPWPVQVVGTGKSRVQGNPAYGSLRQEGFGQ
jgi:hypothetical protein